jgi:hypothetical protein
MRDLQAKSPTSRPGFAFSPTRRQTISRRRQAAQKAIGMTDMLQYTDADLFGIAFSNNQNLALRGKASAELERRRREYENARDAKQVEAAVATARATKFAAWAAGFSAGGAVVTAIVEVIRLTYGN